MPGPPNGLGRGVQWVGPALGLTLPELPSSLGVGPVAPVFDVLQSGIPYATPILTDDITLDAGTPSVMVTQPGGSAGFLIVFLQAVINIGAAQPFQVQAVSPGTGLPFVLGTLALPAAGVAGNVRGLNDFASPPRWVPPTFGVRVIGPALAGGDEIECRVFMWQLVPGFDVVPRGG